MKKLRKSFICIMLALSLLLVGSINVFASEETQANDVLETPLDIEYSLTEIPYQEPPVIEPMHIFPWSHTHKIYNVRKYLLNDFYPVTNYAENRYSQTYLPTVNFSIGKSFTVSGNVTAGIGIGVKEVSAELGVSVGASYTIAAERSYTYSIPYMTRGRIVYRYSRNMYSYTLETCYNYYPNKKVDTLKGSASGPIDKSTAYFTLQQIYL